MSAPTIAKLEHLFQRYRTEHQRKHNCKRVRDQILKFSASTFFKATSLGIVAEGSDSSKRLITWKGNLLEYHRGSLRRAKQHRQPIRKRRPPTQYKTKVLKSRSVASSVHRVSVRTEKLKRSQLIPRLTESESHDARIKRASQSTSKYRRRSDDFEAGNMALRMWD